MLESFFIYGTLPPTVEKGAYLLPLVVLSYAVAFFASYTALALAQQLVSARGKWEKRLLHWGGAFAMGAGIWSMHFIGMLSYKMRMKVEYDPALTLLSMLIAIAVAYGVLAIIARTQLSQWKILVSAVLLGFGICGMHYTGMAAMRMDASLHYTSGFFFLSVVIAIAASVAALWITFTLARHSSRYRYLFQIGAALIMGAAICGMHYTGMAAAVFIPYADCRYDPNQNFDMLALSIAGITSIILGLALVVGSYKKTQTEFLLASSESKLRAIIDNALDAVIAMDQDGNITEWNLQAEAIFGWSYQEALGRPLAELIIPPNYHDAHHRGMQAFLATGRAPILNKRIEVTALNRSGKEFPVELTITGQELPDSHHFTAFIRDITGRKLAEEKTGLLAAIVESSDDAIISKTLDDTISSWNAGAEHLFGYSAAEAIGQHINLIIPQGRRYEEYYIVGQLDKGERVHHYETVRLAKDGHPIDVSLTVSPIRNAAGKITGASKIIHDISARKETEAKLLRYTKELERSNQELDDFAYITSHDLKEPLRGLFNHASFLIEDFKDKLGEEGTQRLHRMAYLSKRMEHLVNDLLYFSRLGRTDLAIQDTDPNKMIHEIQQMLETFLKERNAHIVVPRPMPNIVCDKPRITEVFRNLITNAVKYNDKKERLVEVGFLENIETPNGIGHHVFYVKDNGVGIASEFHQEIFRIFKRLQNPVGEKESGTGAGLTFVKKIVERHGGRIWLESEPGKGTTFYFTVNKGGKHDEQPIH